MIRTILTCAALVGALFLAPGGALAGDAAKGKATYDAMCFTCHGMSGAGDGMMAASLNPKPRNFTTGEYKFDTDKDGTAGTVEDLTNVLKNGAAAYGGSALMAPYGGQLSDEQIADLVAYVQSLKK